jgi:hypothetical protein
MTDVFTPEIEILREQFSDAAKRYPGLQCTIATWHTSCKEPVFCSRKQAGHKDYFLPEELLYERRTLIYRWKHFPCSAKELADPLPPDYDEDERQLILEDCEESVSWQKKTCLVRRENENWEKEKAIEHLSVLTRKMSDFEILFHDACKVKSSDPIDLAYIELQCEFEVYKYGENNRDGDGQLLIDDDCWPLIKWLWLLPVAARHQIVSQLFNELVDSNEYRKALPRWRGSHAPYVMKLDDVFLESALLCSRLVNISKKAARQKHQKDPKKTADTKNGKTTADPSASAGKASLQLEKEVSLLQFMQQYCEKQSRQLLRCRRKSINDARAQKTVTLPEHVGKWKTGMTKRYKAKDLISHWPQYREVLQNLPKLKSEYHT